MQLYLHSIGLAAPGLPNWNDAKKILAGETPWQQMELERYKPRSLPPNEARRATELVRLAFRAAEDAMESSPIAAASLATVFSSSGGDYTIIDQICTALTKPERAVSPTQFHNSVHNSAAGYWSIGTGSTLASTSLSAYDHSFAQGLLEAAGMVLVDGLDTLLVVYDICPPPRLQKKRAILQEFGVALVLSANSHGALARFDMALEQGNTSPCKALDGWKAAFASNPAARSLPLLEMLAGNNSGGTLLELPSGMRLRVGVTPSGVTPCC